MWIRWLYSGVCPRRTSVIMLLSDEVSVKWSSGIFIWLGTVIGRNTVVSFSWSNVLCDQVSLRGASEREISRDALLEKVFQERELRSYTRRANVAALFIQVRLCSWLGAQLCFLWFYCFGMILWSDQILLFIKFYFILPYTWVSSKCLAISAYLLCWCPSCHFGVW